MSLNQLVANIALEELDKFKSDSSLYDAIVEKDTKMILYLVNNRYKLDIINRGYVKEPIRVSKILQELELSLSKNKHIRLLN